METDPKKKRKLINKLRFKTFFENQKRTQKMRKRTQKKEEIDQQTENLTNPNYSEIPQHFSVFKGFPIILEKKRKLTQTHFWVRFHVEAFP